jgi:hypothetical protein
MNELIIMKTVCRNLHYSMGSVVGIPKDNKQFYEEIIFLNGVICIQKLSEVIN